MKKIKNFAKAGLAVLLIAATFTSSMAFAAPYDPIIGFRNSDDTADTSAHIGNLVPNNYIVYGSDYAGSGIPEGYYFDSSVFSIAAAPVPLGNNNYKISLDLGAFNPCNLGNLCDLLDAKTDKTTTVNGHALSSNVTVTKSDLSLGSVDNTSDLSKPVSTATQAALDTKSRAYEGTILRTNAVTYFGHATVASGVATFNMTSDGTSTGSSICSNGIIADSINPIVSDATASYQMSWALSNSNKTITVTTNKLTTSNILTGILGQATANGAVVKLSATCY